MIPKGWDISEDRNTGRFEDGKPIIEVMFQDGLNDIQPDGKTFVPCDTGISEVTQGVTHLKMNRGRMGELRFGDSDHSNSFLVKIKNKALKGVSFKYTGADGASMIANNGKPLCHFDNGISIESAPYYKGVKMDIIINDPLTAPLEYPFSVKTYGQDYNFIEENGGATLRGEDQDPIFIKPPYAVDANGDIGSVTIHYLGMENNLHLFEKVVDETWFRQAAAPVRIDPNITIEDGVDGGVIEDADMNGVSAGSNYGAATFLFHQNNAVGWDWLIKTVVSGLGIGVVTLVKYTFECDFVGGGGGYACQFRQLLRDWNEGNKTGTPAFNGEVTAVSARHNEESWTTIGAKGPGTDYDNIDITGSFNAPASTGSFDVVMDNDIWQARVDGGPNDGDVLHAVIDSGGKSFQLSSSEGATPPQLYIEHTGAAFNPAWARNSNQIMGVNQ